MTPRTLDGLDGLAALRALAPSRLPALASEIRDLLVASVSVTGGHLGVNLGVVELTVALHRVFHSPRDVILFDTGHQAYVHKILTGRWHGFGVLRREGGLSGYPSRAESAHDWVENSHASTALSYADGVAKALRLTGDPDDRRVVAVIGDGALTGGLAWEGLNNLSAAPDRPVIVVLNDNGRSYAPTVGGLARHLARLRDGAGSPIFEELGLAYTGPVDGHDIPAIEAALRRAIGLGRTVVVHVVTGKGRGYPPAEADEADRMHGIGVIDPATGAPAGPAKATWTDVFGEEIAEIGAERPDVVCLTAAMLRPVGLLRFARRFPDRVFDVGIAEQHAVCSAAGLAMAGLHPVVAVYATFLGRAFDQILMDVALHGVPATFVLDRAGITGPDGPSHHGMWDIGLLRLVPGARIAAPRDPARLRELLREAVAHPGLTVVRYPKATAGPDISAVVREDGVDILWRSGRRPADVLLVACGGTARACLDAADTLSGEGLGVTVADPRWIAPVGPGLVQLAARHRLSVTVEDGCRTAGAGAALARLTGSRLVNVGLPCAFVGHGARTDLLASHGISGPAIASTAFAALRARRPSSAALSWPDGDGDDRRRRRARSRRR